MNIIQDPLSCARRGLFVIYLRNLLSQVYPLLKNLAVVITCSVLPSNAFPSAVLLIADPSLCPVVPYLKIPGGESKIMS